MNGQRVAGRLDLQGGERVEFGSFAYLFDGRTLRELEGAGQIRLDAYDVSVPLEGERRVVRLDSNPQIPGEGNGASGAGADEQGREQVSKPGHGPDSTEAPG